MSLRHMWKVTGPFLYYFTIYHISSHILFIFIIYIHASKLSIKELTISKITISQIGDSFTQSTIGSGRVRHTNLFTSYILLYSANKHVQSCFVTSGELDPEPLSDTQICDCSISLYKMVVAACNTYTASRSLKSSLEH